MGLSHSHFLLGPVVPQPLTGAEQLRAGVQLQYPVSLGCSGPPWCHTQQPGRSILVLMVCIPVHLACRLQRRVLLSCFNKSSGNILL